MHGVIGYTKLISMSGVKYYTHMANKWTTIKILNSVKEDIRPLVETGKFSSVSDFVTHVSRNEITKLMENK